jgi:hypothetical protein
MKTKLKLIATCHLLIAFCISAHAQGTAFTYQGQLQNNGSPANGIYNLTFTLFNTNATGVPIAVPVTNNAVFVTNGLFTVLIDFGPGVFTGTNYWLEIAVETNGFSSFITLAPRQQLTPVPYAIFAEGVAASGISGLLTNAQLAHSAVTVDAGPGFSGGGKVTLGNTITLTNTGVLSITGNADITAATVGGAVTLGDTATSADTPNLIVSRDGSGNFSTAAISLDVSLNLPVTTATAGIIYSGGLPLIHAYGSRNFFAGTDAGNLTMSGARNTANGYVALEQNTSGADNTANGAYALLLNTSGFGNTANGSQALYSNTNGADNTASGFQALYFNTSGFANTASGWQALYSNTGDNLDHGSYNTASGAQALYANTLGNDNTANGYEALYSNTGDTIGDGWNNTASGYQALYSNTNGYANTANGFQALYYNASGNYNTANGTYALGNNTTGNNNSANGAYALYSNTNGTGNTANGYHALYLNTSGIDNTANGRAALYNNINGTQNTADGVQALDSNTNGTYNTANGYQALYNDASGSYNLAEGASALYTSTTASHNTAIGYQALYSNTGGQGNIAVGENALFGNKGGDDNIAVGENAGQSLTTGDNNIDIGGDGSAGEANTIRIGFQGTQTNTFIAGIFGTTVSGSTVTVNSSGRLGVAPSSRRFKQDIHRMDDASSVLLALRPVTFKYKPDIDPQGTPQFGLVAEEVAKVDPDLVVRDGKGQIFTVRYEAVNAMLLNEFLKEHHNVEQQTTEIQTLQQQNGSLAKRLNELEVTMKQLAQK